MWKKVGSFISGAGTLWGFLPAAVTASITAAVWLAVMAVIGYLQNVPIFWIMTGLPVAAAAIFTWLLRFAEWRTRNTAAGKLSFGGIQLGMDFTRDAKGNAKTLDKAQVKLILLSAADFPISYVVEELQTSFEGEYPPNMPRLDNGGIVLNRNEIKAYSDNTIDMKSIAPPPRISGTARFKIKYGHAGREKYTLSSKVAFEGAYETDKRNYILLGHRDIL